MKKLFTIILLFCIAMTGRTQSIIRNNDKIAFLGDSITNYGNYYPSGYVKLIMAAMKVNGIGCRYLPRGVGGNKSPQMLARLDRDIIQYHPTRMLLSCGVNDVWHGPRGVSLQDYKVNIEQIVSKARAAGITVDIMTATMIGEDPSLLLNQKLAPYNQFLRELAQKNHLLLIDINQAMQKEISTLRTKYPKAPKLILTVDNVHMNALGNRMMAETILTAWGFSDEMLNKAKTEWDDMIWPVSGFGLSTAEYCRLTHKALAAGMNVSDYIKIKILNIPQLKK